MAFPRGDGRRAGRHSPSAPRDLPRIVRADTDGNVIGRKLLVDFLDRLLQLGFDGTLELRRMQLVRMSQQHGDRPFDLLPHPTMRCRNEFLRLLRRNIVGRGNGEFEMPMKKGRKQITNQTARAESLACGAAEILPLCPACAGP